MVVFLRRRGYFYESFSSASGQRRHGNTNSWSCLVGPDFFNLYSSYRIEEWNACLEDELPIASFRLFSDSARSGWSSSTVFFSLRSSSVVSTAKSTVSTMTLCVRSQLNSSTDLSFFLLYSSIRMWAKKKKKIGSKRMTIVLFPLFRSSRTLCLDQYYAICLQYQRKSDMMEPELAWRIIWHLQSILHQGRLAKFPPMLLGLRR